MKPTTPPPAVMNVDRERWANELHLSNFVNSYRQYDDLRSLPDVRRVLIIGPGQGLDTQILRWRGYEVTTFDIDATFHPDQIGSVHDLSRFADRQFDAVVASHVLEHLALPYLDTALAELARVARYALVYLPVAGRHLQLRFIPGVTRLDLSLVLDFFNFFAKPDGLQPRFCGGDHYWELGMRGFKVRDLEHRFARWFRVLRSYRNRDWLPSYNFVLESGSS